MANGVYLDFERPIVELEEKIEEMERLAEERGIDVSAELSTLQAKLARLKQDIFSHLTPIQRVQLARHPRRPYPLDFVDRCFTDWLELHGDRAYADDDAMKRAIEEARKHCLQLTVLGSYPRATEVL